MKQTIHRRLADLLVAAGAAVLFFGCIATSYRSARTLEPGQVSLGAGFVRGFNVEDGTEEPFDLLNLDFRVSPGKSVDMGLAHTFDLTSGGDGGMATLWGDAKVQLTNTSNDVGALTLATGLMKGYAYHENVMTHFTSIPVVVSYPVSERFTPTLLYRHEFVSEDFLPTDGNTFNNPRHFFALGFEYALSQPMASEPTVKLGASIGTFNHLGQDGDRGVTLNVGVTIDLPSN